MRRWTLISAGLAPVVLIGGWTLAAHLQPADYSAFHQTISALAALGTHDRLVMTSGLLALGLCHLTTAAGLRPARGRGRLMLAIGGAATVPVAMFPQPHSGSSSAHVTAATIGFVALATWPALAARRGCSLLLTTKASFIATAVLIALLVWFATSLDATDIGLAERALAGSESLWPLAVAIGTLDC
jgi:hypothetical membrane protein